MTSIRPNPNGDRPDVHATAYIDPTARIIGRVRIGAGVYVGPYAVVRADEYGAKGRVHSVQIGDESNVQDGVIIHALGGTNVRIGKRTSLAHGCVVHGPCSLGNECFVGFRAVVYDSRLEDGVFVGAAAVVQGVDLRADAFVGAGVAVTSVEDVTKLVGTKTNAHCDFVERVVKANLALAEGYDFVEGQVQKS